MTVSSSHFQSFLFIQMFPTSTSQELTNLVEPPANCEYCACWSIDAVRELRRPSSILAHGGPF